MENNIKSEIENKKKKEKRNQITAIIIIIVMLCSGFYGLIFSATGSNQTPRMSLEEELAFVTDFEEKVLGEANPGELMDLLDENIGLIDPENAKIAVDGLMYAITNNYPNMTLTEETKAMILSEMAKGVNVNDITTYGEIEDQSFADFLSNLNHMGYYIHMSNGVPYVQIDYSRVSEKYKEYVDEDFQDVISLLQRESTKSYLDPATEETTLDYKEVIERIILAEELIEKHSESSYLEFLVGVEGFYYQLYFGQGEDAYVFDTSETILDEALVSYKTVLLNYPESRLAEKVTEYISLLEKNGNKKTADVEVYLLDLANIPYEDITAETTDEDSLKGNSDLESVLAELAEKK